MSGDGLVHVVCNACGQDCSADYYDCQINVGVGVWGELCPGCYGEYGVGKGQRFIGGVRTEVTMLEALYVCRRWLDSAISEAEKGRYDLNQTLGAVRRYLAAATKAARRGEEKVDDENPEVQPGVE